MIKASLQVLKKILGKNLTRKVRPLGHGVKTYIAASRYGFPAKKLEIIGITGTKGKTTTTILTGRLSNLVDVKTGFISTGLINLGDFHDAEHQRDGEFENPYKMTSIDGAILHKYLQTMIRNGCKRVVLELSSQGLEQNRHWGLGQIDAGIFLNLYPEHIEAHGSIERYRACKNQMLQMIRPGGVLVFNNDQPEEMDIQWNMLTPGHRKNLNRVDLDVSTHSLHIKHNTYELDGVETGFSADFEVSNALFAATAIDTLSQKPINTSIGFFKDITGIPGRSEWVHTSKDLSVMVDYAHEPESIKRVLQNLKKLGYSRIIHVVSCDGVGRDDWKKPLLATNSQQYADISILTTDNYGSEDNPQNILDMLSSELKLTDKDKKWYRNINRKEAMKLALKLAQGNKDTVIVSTGVGNEVGLTQPEGTIEWSEKAVWQELLRQ